MTTQKIIPMPDEEVRSEPVMEKPAPVAETPADTPTPEPSQVSSGEISEGKLSEEPSATVATSTPTAVPEELPPAAPSTEPIGEPVPAVQLAPVSAPPVPAPSYTSPKSFLARAIEAIRFRKRAKLEKIMRLATLRQAQGGNAKGITNDDVEKLVRVSHATAFRYLRELVLQGRLRQTGNPRDARYEPT